MERWYYEFNDESAISIFIFNQPFVFWIFSFVSGHYSDSRNYIYFDDAFGETCPKPLYISVIDECNFV